MKIFVIFLLAAFALSGVNSKAVKYNKVYQDFTKRRKKKCKEGDPPGPADSDKTGDYGGIIPTFYDLSLQLPVYNDQSRSSYVTVGSMNFHFRVNRKAKYVYLMTQDTVIKMSQVSMTHQDPISGNSTSVPLAYKCLDAKRYSMIVRPETQLEPQLVDDPTYYVISISTFQSQIRRPYENGIFTESSGEGPKGEAPSIVTQFQTEFSRFAFPNVDIPQFKTPFRVKIIHPPDTNALSNMELIENGVNPDGWLWAQFVSSPPLPSYLIAFSIKPSSVVKHVTMRTHRDVNLTVYTESNSLNSAEELLDDAVYCLNELYTQLQAPLQLRKIDFVQIDGFPFGGMENFGMITLMYSLWGSTAVHIQAHELAHFWFGDMVTVRNWRPLAVQEGLTDYFSARTTVKYYQYHNKEHKAIIFLHDEISGAYYSAASESLYIDYSPLIFEVLHKLYGKSTYLIGNLEGMLGEKEFLKRIREFINQHSYSDFDMADFKSFFDDVTYKIDNDTYSVADMYEHWFTRGGFPQISVSRNLSQNTITIYELGDAEGHDWLIPIKLEIPGSNITDFYPKLIKGSATIDLSEIADKDDAVISNPGGIFFYPVADDAHNSELLLKMIAEKPDSLSFRTKTFVLTNFCMYVGEVKGSLEVWEKYGQKIREQEPDISLGSCPWEPSIKQEIKTGRERFAAFRKPIIKI